MRILLIEDHVDLGDAIEAKLHKAGHSVEWVRHGDTACSRGKHETWDAVVLDIMLPGKNGFEILREIRAAACETPVLIITARAEIEDKVDMLDLGADDYLVKPFDLRELEARLRALMRRPAGNSASIAVYGNLTLDLSSRVAAVSDAPLELGRREFCLLEVLLAKLGQTITKERLVTQLFDDTNDVSSNAVELLVSRLRRKLAHSSIDIVTMRGVGYLARKNDAA